MLYQKLFSAARDKCKEDLIGSLKQVFDEKKLTVEANKEIMTKSLIFADVMGDGMSCSDRKFDEI